MKYDISFGDTSPLRLTFKPYVKNKPIIINVPYKELDFFKYVMTTVLGIKRIPKAIKGSGRYQWKYVFIKSYRTAFRWIDLMKEHNLCILPVKHGECSI